MRFVSMAATIGTMIERNTFNGWAAEGRAVRKGEKAMHYLANYDLSRGIAVFTREQTELVEEDLTGLQHLIPAEEWRARNARPTNPRLKIKPHGDGIAIWVGSDKRLIAVMKETGYRFDPGTYRWLKPNKDLPTVVQKLREWDPTLEVVVEA